MCIQPLLRSCVVGGLLLASQGAFAQTKVACVGDSITHGYGLADPATQSYPSVLQVLLGADYVVQNFGQDGAAAQNRSIHPYSKTPSFEPSKAFAPAIVVLMLGTNDAANWSRTDYETDYRALLAAYRAVGAKVFVVTPPPVYGEQGFGISPLVLSSQVVPAVRQIAETEGAPLIDVNSALANQAAWFPDLVHPNADGASAIATAVASGLRGVAGGGTGGAPATVGGSSGSGMSGGGSSTAGAAGLSSAGAGAGAGGGLSVGGSMGLSGGAGSSASVASTSRDEGGCGYAPAGASRSGVTSLLFLSLIAALKARLRAQRG